MRKLRTLFHPIFVFIGVQVAWLGLMGIWVYWYFKNNLKLEEFASKLRPELFNNEFSWVILLEGSFLMLIILAGVYVIFVYWNKQARLNQLQSNFVSSVSHELKSPLASIQLYLETMKYQKVSPGEAGDFVETMLTDTERLSGLIDNILQSSKAEAMRLQFQPVHIGEFLQEVVKAYKRQFEERKCEVRLDLNGAGVHQVDKRALRMVFNNLIGNALRYSPVGQPLVIEVKDGKKYLDIHFIDQGIGIEKKDRKKVFKKFYRAQNVDTQNIEGAGLGLFISHEIVKNHKGRLTVESEGRGKGTRFTVSLPH